LVSNSYGLDGHGCDNDGNEDWRDDQVFSSHLGHRVLCVISLFISSGTWVFNWKGTEMRDTIDMAQEAQISDTTIEFYQQELKAFEALVRADERNELAKHFEQAKQAGIHTDWVAAAIRARGNT
jgi:hypothetical protein